GNVVLAGNVDVNNVFFYYTGNTAATCQSTCRFAGVLLIKNNSAVDAQFNGVSATGHAYNLSAGQIKFTSGIWNGAAPVVGLSPTSLNFGNQLVGSSSAAQSVTLTNSGAATLTISSISASGDFSQTNTCPSSLGPAANCTISVTFTPTAAGS